MDILAKKIDMEQVHSKAPITAHDTSLDLGTIRCGGDLISSRIQQSLYSTVLHKGILREYASKLNIPDSVLQEITHWTALHKARKEANLSLKIFMTKWQVVT